MDHGSGTGNMKRQHQGIGQHRGKARRGRLLMLAAAGFVGSAAGFAEEEPEAPWNARTAEHLWNRAGFGAAPDDIARAVRIGREAFVEELLEGDGPVELPFYRRLPRGKRRPVSEFADVDPDVRFFGWRDDVQQLSHYLDWWVQRMVEGSDPLRERMTLFWHGHFTTSGEDVKNSHEIILQNQFLRENALGSFRDLVHGISRDPAMMDYLDVDESEKENPNENFARELMELFTLGEGNYTEQDVREVARAFTGWRAPRGEFRIARRKHDFGEKTVLGVTGPMDGGDVIDVLLDHPSCAPFIAGKLLRWFEGVEPDPDRLEQYARFLRESDYEITPFLRALFLDPRFYRAEVVGERIAGPIDFLVGSARRLGIEPPARLIFVGAGLLGQKLTEPPSVKGWEEGEAWITTAALIHRSNLAAVLLGQMGLEDILLVEDRADGRGRRAMAAGFAPRSAPNVEEARMADSDGAAAVEATDVKVKDAVGMRDLKAIWRLGWRPRMNLTERMLHLEARKDSEIVKSLTDGLLAVRAGKETRKELVAWLRFEREQRGVGNGKLLKQPLVAEPLLRELAHLVLSLPEANLH